MNHACLRNSNDGLTPEAALAAHDLGPFPRRRDAQERALEDIRRRAFQEFRGARDSL